MDAKGWIMLRVLVNRFYGGVTQDLQGKFQKADLKALKKLNVRSTDADRAMQSPASSIQRIHYSWITPQIQQMPSELQQATISALDGEQQRGVCKQLRCKARKQAPAPPIRRYLLNELYHRISPQSRLPARYLPHSYLNPLGEYDKTKLLRLVDLLGLRDLVPSVKQMVRSHNVGAILNCLNEEERRFFDFYLYRQRDTVNLPPILLKDWKGDCKSLRQQIHRKGLKRLGKALSGQDETLIWYILHTLDTGRAAILEKNTEEEPISEVTTELLKQVLGLMNYLDKQQ